MNEWVEVDLASDVAAAIAPLIEARNVHREQQAFDRGYDKAMEGIEARAREARADALDTAQDEHEQNYLNQCARYLLTSTDPEVHAAMLDALVRAGVLVEEFEDRCGSCGAAYGKCENLDDRCRCSEANWVEFRRYVTEWEAL